MAQYANIPSKSKGHTPKIFVLDTNIILHDYKCIRKFQDNDLVIPVAVLEELDKFKKGNDALSYNARGSRAGNFSERKASQSARDSETSR